MLLKIIAALLIMISVLVVSSLKKINLFLSLLIKSFGLELKVFFKYKNSKSLRGFF